MNKITKEEKVMTVKEKVIRKAIEQIEFELLEIEGLINANPLAEICRLRIKGQELIKKEKEMPQEEFMAELSRLVEEEKKQFAIAEKTKNILKLSDRKLDLTFELRDLNTELWHLKNKR